MIKLGTYEPRICLELIWKKFMAPYRFEKRVLSTFMSPVLAMNDNRLLCAFLLAAIGQVEFFDMACPQQRFAGLDSFQNIEHSLVSNVIWNRNRPWILLFDARFVNSMSA